jgi:hypothetical protein
MNFNEHFRVDLLKEYLASKLLGCSIDCKMFEPHQKTKVEVTVVQKFNQSE